jgi:endonuclease/exonuclease/phosphatase family metal-dependent hydrolase
MELPLRIAVLNAENLFLTLPGEATGPYQKSIFKARELARAISDIDPDLLFLAEVGGIKSLQLFNQNYLQENFIPSLIPGNSDRGIELGVLIKKNLPYRFAHGTHKNRPLPFNYHHEIEENALASERGLPLPHSSHAMSRDLLELRLFNNDDQAPVLIILFAHLKSKLDKEGIDSEGKMRRKAEFEYTLKAAKALTGQFDCPVIICGDLNGNALREAPDFEFSAIQNYPELKDILEVLNIPPRERGTFIYFSGSERRELQMDYILLPEQLHPAVIPETSGLYYYKNADGMPHARPTNHWQKDLLPSDHYPIIVDLEDRFLVRK